MTTLSEIHAEIERLSEDRAELWHKLSHEYDPEVREEIRRLDAELNRLWTTTGPFVRSSGSAIAQRSSPAPASRSAWSARPEALAEACRSLERGSTGRPSVPDCCP